MAHVAPIIATVIHKKRENGTRYVSKAILSLFVIGIYIPRKTWLIEPNEVYEPSLIS